jgi:hypothetical protein
MNREAFMKTLLSRLVPWLAFLGLSASAGAAGNQCFIFVNYEGVGGPEPTRLECTTKSKSLKDCMKACAAAARKNCPKGATEFSGTANFNSPTAGFEADGVQGSCGK